MAVVLSGCGVFDGSEVTEAVSVIVAASRHGAEVQCFAPAAPQSSVVNHQTGEAVLAPPLAVRDARAEAARIARGPVADLADLNVADFDAIIFPGGFGAAKNLSNFWSEGQGCHLLDAAGAALRGFHDAGKPIGLTCIAPVLAARAFKGVTVTLGRAAPAESWPYGSSIKEAEGMGATVVEADVGDVVVDSKHRVATTPAYMCDTAPHVVAAGVDKLVTTVLAMA